ncbi:MAG: BolA family transcriptional regulator [Nannocystaceae bacterium]|nr:BolA family transcriptional regulator [Nannocystaceae bacterium]
MSVGTDRAALLHDRVVAALAPAALELVDESHLHAGGKGKQSHFKLVVVAAAFEGRALLARHRLVHDAVGELLATKQLHALSIHAYTPAEWLARGEVMPQSPPCRGGSKTD